MIKMSRVIRRLWGWLRGRCACMDGVADVDEVRDADGSIPFEDFSEMRDRCRALREILLPDSIWQQFREWHSLPDDVAAHRSILLLAFRRGCLSSDGCLLTIRSSGIGCQEYFEVGLSNCNLHCGLRTSPKKLSA
jgi:hypothetical protein